MKLSLRHLPVAIACATQSAWSADALVHVTFDKNPLAGIEVLINKESKGKTDKAGNFFVNTGNGQQTVELVRDGAVISSVNFVVKGSEAVEVNVAFDTSKALPETNVRQFSSLIGGAQGFIGGLVTNADGEPLSGVTVTATDSGESATSDTNGFYNLALPRGKQSVSFSHPEFKAASVNDVYILADLGVAANVTLNKTDAIEAPGSVEEVVVLGSYNPEDTAASLERYSSTVTDALDMTQLARFGDSNVAGALTRLVGVSVNDGKYAVVRGLDGRYISSSLNGFMMPSTDPMRRDVQLDLFPSNILQGVEVQKSYSPELSGTTTGGSLKIATRGLPEERINKISISGGYNSAATGSDIVSYKESSTDWLGYDSGLRDLNDAVVEGTDGGRSLIICDPSRGSSCTSPIVAAGYGVAFEDDYDIKDKKANPNFSAGYSYGDRIDLGEGSFGFYGAVNYSNLTDNRENATLSDLQGLSGSYQRSQETINTNAYLVTGYEFNEQDEILSKTIALRSSDNTTRVTSGLENLEERTEDRFILQWVERQFLSQQFSGKHAFDFNETHELEWRLGYSQTKRYEPDRRTYSYINGSLSTSTVERRWNDLTEDSTDFGLNYKLPINITDDIFSTIDAGATLSQKSRDVELYRFGIVFAPNSGLSGSIEESLEDTFSYVNFARDRVRLKPNTTSTDSYGSDEDVAAYYINTSTEFSSNWTLATGVRLEDFDQSLIYPNNLNSNNDLNSSNTLPSLTLTYRPTEEIQIRAGYSKTVSYPGIIERAASSTFHPLTDDQVFGNENLTISKIENLDLRAEYYFSDDESISVALFHKDIDAPVEQTVADGSGSAADGITYRNAQSATVSGLEIDFNKNIIDTTNYLGFLSGNISLVESEVELDPLTLAIEGRDDLGRELQGQSPVLANLQFGLDHFETEQKFTVLINYFDDKIFRTTRGEFNTPEYLSGQVKLDFNYEKLFGERLTFKAKAKNLLNAKTEFVRNNRVIESFEAGTSFSASLNYEF